MAAQTSRTKTSGSSKTPKAEQAASAAGEQQQASQDRESQEGEQARTATLTLPFVTAEFRLPRVSWPRVSRREVSDAAKGVTSALPPPERTAYYAGLGLLAAFEVIEWPVAVAIGVGTAVTQRALRQSRQDKEAGASSTQPASAS